MASVGVFIYWVCEILTILVIIRALLSWFPSVSPYGNPLVRLLWQITEPMLAPFRRYVSAGGFDFSAWIVVIILQIIGNLAASLL